MKNLISLILILFFIGCSNLEKPNIIWITIEDQSQYLLPFNGNDDISLPNLQKIADESLIFENMYSDIFRLKKPTPGEAKSIWLCL